MNIFNPISVAKAEAMKIDENHDGKPDIIQGLDAIDSVLKKASGLFTHVNANDIEAIFALLPPQVKAKIPPVAITELANEIAQLPEQLQKASIALESWEQKLEAK